MTHPSVHARNHPDKIAYQMAASGKAITYRELDELSNQGAHLFRKLGLKAGDHVALLMENRLAFMEICWAAQRAGLYYTAISRYLTQDEIAYIVRDCGAKVFITSPKCFEQVKNLTKDFAYHVIDLTVAYGSDPDQVIATLRAVYEDMKAGIASNFNVFKTIREDGALMGPWNPWLHEPVIGKAIWDLTLAMTAKATLPDNVRQVVILVVGARFDAAYEIYAHIAVAEKEGMAPARLAASTSRSASDESAD